MRYRRLGQTDLQVSEIGFGAWAIGGNKHGHSYGPAEQGESLAAIRRAFELGCTFFDTADIYGHGLSEKLLHQALQSHRHECVIATKVGNDFYHGPFRKNFDPDYIRFAVEKSLQRLQTDYIALAGTPWTTAQFNIVQNRLIKIAVKVREMATQVKLSLPTSFPLQSVCHKIMANLARAAP